MCQVKRACSAEAVGNGGRPYFALLGRGSEDLDVVAHAAVCSSAGVPELLGGELARRDANEEAERAHDVARAAHVELSEACDRQDTRKTKAHKERRCVSTAALEEALDGSRGVPEVVAWPVLAERRSLSLMWGIYLLHADTCEGWSRSKKGVEKTSRPPTRRRAFTLATPRLGLERCSKT